ncbi:hypothetical protein TURU_161076 [Turdus rufiventris]|nr:hypothetical protein TURU_161076 [Turdus rufiventris]
MSNIHEETKKAEHNMKFRRTTMTVLQSEGFSKSNRYQQQTIKPVTMQGGDFCQLVSHKNCGRQRYEPEDSSLQGSYQRYSGKLNPASPQASKVQKTKWSLDEEVSD